jgi:hypothetical protein
MPLLECPRRFIRSIGRKSRQRRLSGRLGRLNYRILGFRAKLMNMAVRQVQLSPEAEPILDSVASSFGGDVGLAISELLIAHESIESFLDEMESSNAEELTR